jgi:aminoglycoside phosphotransferase
MIMAHRRLPQHILQRLPAAWRTDLERVVAEPVARGMSGAKLWRLPAVSQITGERYLKVAEGALAADLREEIARSRWLGARGIRVPRVARVHEGPRLTAMISDALDGVPADEIDWPAERLLPLLGHALARVHALPVHGCPFDEGHAVRLARARAAVEQGSVDPAQFASRNRHVAPTRLLARLQAAHPPKPDLVVVHGDASLSNLLVDGNGTVGFLDCGHVGRADRYVDLAVLAAEVVAHFGEGARRLLTRAYGLRRWNARKAAYYEDLYEFF